MTIDKVTLQILSNHCQAAAEAMARTLMRTAHSTFVKESEDFTCGLVTPGGKTFASPFDFGATWFVGLDYARGLGLIDAYDEGDVVICNDPYSGFVCTHTPDMHIWKPIFHDGEVVCFAVGHVHNTDIGGAVPASLSRQLTEVHQEGLRPAADQALPQGRTEPGTGRHHHGERAHARAELGRHEGAAGIGQHRGSESEGDHRPLRRRHLQGRRRGSSRPRRDPGAAGHRLDSGRGVLLRRLHGRGFAGRLSGPRRPQSDREGRRDRLRLHRLRPPAGVLDQRSHRWRRTPRAADGGSGLRALYARPVHPAKPRLAPAAALHPAGRLLREPPVPGRRRHEKPRRGAPHVDHLRRLRPGPARPAPGRSGKRRAPAKRAHHRQPLRAEA